jgi:predicted MFS family arabinose efflux permease
MDWMADRVLPSSLMFYTALIAPLAVIPMSAGVKTLLMIVASNWIQWWALPALQRRQNEISDKQDAKADADYESLTHLSNKVDRIESILLHPSYQKAKND